MSNKCKPNNNNNNNDCRQQFFSDLMNKSAKNSVIYGTQSLHKDLNNNQKESRKSDNNLNERSIGNNKCLSKQSPSFDYSIIESMNCAKSLRKPFIN